MDSGGLRVARSSQRVLVHRGAGLRVGGGGDDGTDTRSRFMADFATTPDGGGCWVRPVIEESLTVDCSPLVFLVKRVGNERVFSLLVVGTIRASPRLLGLQLA